MLHFLLEHHQHRLTRPNSHHDHPIRTNLHSLHAPHRLRPSIIRHTPPQPGVLHPRRCRFRALPAAALPPHTRPSRLLQARLRRRVRARQPAHLDALHAVGDLKADVLDGPIALSGPPVEIDDGDALGGAGLVGGVGGEVGRSEVDLGGADGRGGGDEVGDENLGEVAGEDFRGGGEPLHRLPEGEVPARDGLHVYAGDALGDGLEKLGG